MPYAREDAPNAGPVAGRAATVSPKAKTPSDQDKASPGAEKDKEAAQQR